MKFDTRISNKKPRKHYSALLCLTHGHRRDMLWQSFDRVSPALDIHQRNSWNLSEALSKIVIRCGYYIASMLCCSLYDAIIRIRSFMLARKALESRILCKT